MKKGIKLRTINDQNPSKPERKVTDMGKRTWEKGRKSEKNKVLHKGVGEECSEHGRVCNSGEIIGSK